MQALVYNDDTKAVTLETAFPKPTAAPEEALIKIHRAGVCATVSIQALAALCVELRIV